jgi:hypothetical protein
MSVEIWTEAVQFLEKEYINGIFLAECEGCEHSVVGQDKNEPVVLVACDHNFPAIYCAPRTRTPTLELSRWRTGL